MMMQQSYHGGSDLEAFHRTNHRNMAHTVHYDRATPYGFHEPRHELRQTYPGRTPAHTSIHEPDEPLTAGGQARRRIAVACGRCRRRKIKCSGDPGDGTGCLACRSSGVKFEDCNFCRVNSETLEVIPAGNDAVSTKQYSIDSSQQTMGNPPTSYPGQQRPSLPVLQTRTTWPPEFDTQYESSPVDACTYGSASAPRHDSITGGAYGSSESYRTYGTSAPLSAPISSPYSEAGTYSFGSLHSPASAYVGNARLPSVSAESMSSLDMGSLHSSLPSHTPLERRLPPVVSYSISYPQRQAYSQSLPEPPAVNPATANFRPYINGVHSRHAMPWSVDSHSSFHGSTSMNSPNYASTSPSQHQMRGSLPVTTAPMPDAVLGYQFQPPSSTYSPESSPPVVSTLGEPFPNTVVTAMLPPAHPTSLRYNASSTSLPAIQAPIDGARPSSSRTSEMHAPAPTASLYSYSSETSDRSSSDATARDNSGRDDRSPCTEASSPNTTYSAYPQARHDAQPQHSASHDGLRRLSEYDHQGTGGPGHRMSVRSLNERY